MRYHLQHQQVRGCNVAIIMAKTHGLELGNSSNATGLLHSACKPHNT